MPRLAYVVGNKDYRHWTSLRNSINDVNGIAHTLRKIGFKVECRTNLDYAGFSQSIYEFGQMLKSYQVGLFYYAGHGIEINGENYMIPTDAEIKTMGLITSASIRLTSLLDWMSNYKENTNIIILDACRTHISMADFRGIKTTGLLPISAPKGTFISYSTSPGSKAGDGNGENSLFAEGLMQFMAVEGEKIEDIFKKVRFYVETETNGEQLPWDLSALIGDFYFIEPRHHFSQEGVTPQIIYNYAESIWGDFEKQYSSDKAEALVIIATGNHFNIPILEVYRGYAIVQNEPYYQFSDAELCVLGVERLESIGFIEKNHRWYYDGNPIRMGEILPLPNDLERMLPEAGYEIDVKVELEGFFEGEKFIFAGHCNLPTGMDLLLSFRSIETQYFAQDKVKINDQRFTSTGFSNKGERITKGKYILEITSAIYSVQPEEIKVYIGNRGRNLCGKNIQFNVIGGNTLEAVFNLDVD